jgi:hypothetical protein
VVFEYAQTQLPPPIESTKQAFRRITVANNSFNEWFGPHDTHVNRFNLG